MANTPKEIKEAFLRSEKYDELEHGTPEEFLASWGLQRAKQVGLTKIHLENIEANKDVKM